MGGYILSNQRFYPPEWVPVIGSDFVDVDAVLSNAQAVVPGQGQTVNIAGVKVGEIGKVTLENGRATVQMKIRRKYLPLYNDASILLRPKTGLKDMYLELDPGNPRSGKLAKGRAVPLARTLPDVNPDEFLASLDADTQAYLRVLLNSGAEALRGRRAGRAAPDLQAVRAHDAGHRQDHASSWPSAARTSAGRSTTSRRWPPRWASATPSCRSSWTPPTPTSRPSPRRRPTCASRWSCSPAR